MLPTSWAATSRGMNTSSTLRLLGFCALSAAAAAALAQDAGRGAALYRSLPGQPGVGSCISCHGEPINNRNSVLRGAAGPAYIARTIGAVGAMGFLRQYLTEADLADIAAYLSNVVPPGALDELPAPWPTVDDFGAHAIGTAAPERAVLLRNLQPRNTIAIGTVLSSDPLTFPVQHDCPLSLPPLGQCRVRSWFMPQRAGPAEASFQILDTSGRLLRSGLLTGTGTPTAPPRLEWAAGSELLLDFDSVTVGTTARRTLRLRNPSSAAVQLQRLRVTGPDAARYSLAAPCAAAGMLAAGAECELTVSHTPNAPARSEGWIELVSDASQPPLVRVTALGLTADALAPPAPVDPGTGGSAGNASGSGGGALSALWVALLALATALLRLNSRRAGRCP